MKKIIWTISLFVLLVINFGICGSTYAGEWRFPVGLSYVSGVSDIGDLIEDNASTAYVDADVTAIPVGITFRPYYEWDMGLGVGMDFGPVMMTVGDVDFFNLPISATCRYAFLADRNVSPYVKAGVSYNIVSGDYDRSSDPGLIAAVGVEFMRNRAVGMGIEVAYNTSEIEFDDYDHYPYIKTIKPCEYTVTFSAIF